MQHNSTQFQTGEELDDFLALVREKINNMGGGSGTLTKEQIEQVLTGNIETHTHETRYSFTGPETDEWDGSSVSESLEGSGTEQDPYLIQSCADYVHFIKNPSLYSMTDSQAKVIKITKNLDFGSHEIDMDGFFDFSVSGDTTNIFLNGILVDGGGMVLSNLNLKNAWSVFPQSTYATFHDIHIRDVNLYINGSSFNDDATQQILSLIRGVGGFGAVYNVSITGALHINGDINPTGETHVLTIHPDAHIDGSTEEIKSSSFSSLDVRFENTTLTENGDNAVLLFLSNIPGSVTYTTSQTTYSESNMYGVFACAIESTATAYADPAKTAVIYAGSDSHLINKTWNEMKSDGFIDLLNSYQDVFSEDLDNVNNGFPVFKQGMRTLEYDGYVKESVLKKKLNEIQDAGKDKELNDAIRGLLKYYDANATDGILNTTITDNVIPGLRILLTRVGSYQVDVRGLISNTFGLPMKSCDVVCMPGQMVVMASVNYPMGGLVHFGFDITVGTNSDNDITLEGVVRQYLIFGDDNDIEISAGDKNIRLAQEGGRDNYVLNEKGEYVKIQPAGTFNFSSDQQNAIIDAINDAIKSASEGKISQEKYNALSSAVSVYPTYKSEPAYVRKSNISVNENGKFVDGYVRAKQDGSVFFQGELYDDFRYTYDKDHNAILTNNIIRRILDITITSDLSISIKERSITLEMGGYGDEFLSADGTYKRISGANPKLGEFVYNSILSHESLPKSISYEQLKSYMGGRTSAFFGMPYQNIYYTDYLALISLSGVASLDESTGNISISAVAMGYNLHNRTDKYPMIKFGNYTVKSDGSISKGGFYTRTIGFDTDTTVNQYSLMSLKDNADAIYSLSQLPIEYKAIKIELSESSELSFAGIPEEGSEYTLYVRNNSNSDITQQIKTNDSWKCKMDSVNIPAGEIIILHIRYAFGYYLVSVDSFN